MLDIVIAAPPLPTYSLLESDLGMGASYGNSAVWIHTKGTGALERVFLNSIGRPLLGGMSLRYGARSRWISEVGPSRNGRDSEENYCGLFATVGARRFELHPAYQRVSFQLAGVVDVEETTFLPLSDARPGHDDPPIVYVTVSLRNRDDVAHHVRIVGSAMFRGSTPPDVQAYYEENARALVAFNASHPEWVRLFSVSEEPTGYAADLDYGSTYDPTTLRPVTNSVHAQGDLIGHLQVDVLLEPGERRQVTFTIAVGASGPEQAIHQCNLAEPADVVLERSIRNLQEQLRYGRVLTPDAMINEGALWSKVNMRRVMAPLPAGPRLHQRTGRFVQRRRARLRLVCLRQRPLLPEFSRVFSIHSPLRNTRTARSPNTTTRSTATWKTTALTSTTTPRCSSWR